MPLGITKSSIFNLSIGLTTSVSTSASLSNKEVNRNSSARVAVIVDNQNNLARALVEDDEKEHAFNQEKFEKEVDEQPVIEIVPDEIESFDKTLERLRLMKKEEEKQREEMELRINQLLEQGKEERKRQLLEEAKKQRDEIWLEVSWIYKVSGMKDRQKSCRLIKKTYFEKEKIIPNVMYDADIQDSLKEHCDQTIWSKRKNKEVKGYEEGLWIRGVDQAVKKAIKESWEDIRDSGFTNDKKSLAPQEISESISELNSSCEVKKFRDLTEVKCLNKEIVFREKNPKFHFRKG